MTEAITFAGLMKNSIYKDRDVIHALVPPSGIVHRTEQRNELVMELAPILMNSAVSCIFVYGNPGTGKTSLVSQLLEELANEAKKSDIAFTKVYVNCSENRTETTILIDILSQLNPEKDYPRIGWTRAKALKEFTEVLNKLNTNVLCVLDEVDYALKESGDDILYRLSRINNDVSSKVSTLLISNDVRVSDYIKPKTASTMGRVKIIFAPYSAQELKDILKERVKYAFVEGAVSEAVISKIAEI
ncbi:NACHT domain-containing protein, partial [Candidatus Woesearchaeota archaeon]